MGPDVGSLAEYKSHLQRGSGSLPNPANTREPVPTGHSDHTLARLQYRSRVHGIARSTGESVARTAPHTRTIQKGVSEMAIPSEEKNRLKKGCLWIGGIAVGGFLLLGVISTIVDPDGESRRAAIEEALADQTSDEPDKPGETTASRPRFAPSVSARRAIADLEEARKAVHYGSKDVWITHARKSLDSVTYAFDTANEGSSDMVWALAWVAVAAAELAYEQGNLAQESSEEYLYQSAAALNEESLESCTAFNRTRDFLSRSDAAYNVAIASLGGTPVKFDSSEDDSKLDCSELEPLKLGAGGSSLEPEMTYRFAGENATYFTSKCGPRVSPIMPVVEQERCFSTGEKAYRFFKSWVPQADLEWVNASQDRRAQLERAAETYRKNVTSTLETLGWMQGEWPSFTAHSIN